jgi:hypothetical protein
MADGSTSSGDDLVAGRANRADGTTFLVGKIPSDHDVGFAFGTHVLNVQVETGADHPLALLNGIKGQGFLNGLGIHGIGGTPGGSVTTGGTGVRGSAGNGGIGVEAFGGEGTPTTEPGSGVEANGGTGHPTGANRKPNGPGVVAIAGGSSQATTLAETGNVGVFGQGGDQVEETKNDGANPNFIIGPDFAGAGVVGRGGINRTNHGAPNSDLETVEGGSAGVVGIAGGSKTPPPPEYSGVGVFGGSKSHEGVKGVSDSGVGLSGESSHDRGAILHSTKQAQLNLRPVLTGAGEVEGKSQLGDLLVTQKTETVEGRGDVVVAHLWFCSMVDADGKGNWVQLA